MSGSSSDERMVRQNVHGRDQAVPLCVGVPLATAIDRTPLADAGGGMTDHRAFETGCWPTIRPSMANAAPTPTSARPQTILRSNPQPPASTKPAAIAPNRKCADCVAPGWWRISRPSCSNGRSRQVNSRSAGYLPRQPQFVPTLGMRTLQQLDEARAAEPLTAEQLAEVEAIAPRGAIAGTVGSSDVAAV